MAKKERDEKQVLMADLLAIESEIDKKKKVGHPSTYGMSDLLFPQGFEAGNGVPEDYDSSNLAADEELQDGWVRKRMAANESDDAYRLRQNQALHSFVVKEIYVVKDTKKVKVFLIPKMVEFMGDVFYTRVEKVILWKPRGGGGSLSAAILIFLLMVYKKLSVLDIAGSKEQSKVVYNYVKQFWNCFPLLKQNLLSVDPLISETRLVTGVTLQCAPATDKQVRGKHVSVLFIDEACQEGSQSNDALRAGLQGVLSETEPIIVMLSTFHLPSGLFQEHWDQAEEKGFVRYKWSCFDTMKVCERGLEDAPADDPTGLKYCEKCFLTYPKEVLDEKGNMVTSVLTGCNGKARNSSGWAPFGSIVEARKLNIGSNVFEIEFACERPNYQSSIYDQELIDLSCVAPQFVPQGSPCAVGIDWGLEGEHSLCMTLGFRFVDHNYLHEAFFMDHKLVSDAAEILFEWRRLYGDFPVLCDSSHPFNNLELSNLGYDVRAVNFGTWKKHGISNLSKFFVFRRLKLNRTLTMMVKSLKMFRRSEKTGRAVKHNDHGPDSLMCMMLNWRFEDEFGPDIDKMSILPKPDTTTVKPYTFNDAGISPVVAPNMAPQRQRKSSNVMVF